MTRDHAIKNRQLEKFRMRKKHEVLISAFLFSFRLSKAKQSVLVEFK